MSKLTDKIFLMRNMNDEELKITSEHLPTMKKT